MENFRMIPSQCRFFLAVVMVVVAGLMLVAPATARASDRGVLVAHADDELQRNSHAIGFTGDVQLGFLGFAYRKYMGNHAVEINALPLMADRGDYLAMSFGARYIHYALLWQGRSAGSMLPSTSALRLVAGTGIHFQRDNQAAIDVPDENCNTAICQDIENSQGKIEWRSQFAGGFGFEFGALQRSGFSFAADLMMTLFVDEKGFDGAYPLPYATLAYSW